MLELHATQVATWGGGRRPIDVWMLTQHGEEGGGPLMFGCCTQHDRNMAHNMTPKHFFDVVKVNSECCEDSFLCCEHSFGCCEASYGNVPNGRPGASTSVFNYIHLKFISSQTF
jgi:hypothetical protein